MQDPERPKQGSQSSLVALEAASAASEVQRSSGGSRQKPEERVTLEDGLGSLYACLRLSSKHFCLATTLALSAILFILLALFGPDAVQRAMDEGIHRAIIWAPDSPEDVDIRYRGVCDPHDPRALLSHVVLYMYNITNVDAIRAEGAKPHVELVGPYRYLKVTCRLDVWWDSDGRVSSKEYTHYVEPFEGRQPGDADPDASITTLNLALGSVVEAIHANVGPQTSEWLDLLVSVLAGWQDPRVDGMFVHRTARDLLWGYEDQLLLRLKSLLPPGKVPRTRVQLVENVTGPEEARTRPASLFETGAHNLLDIWTILKDRNVSEVTAWPGGEACIEPVRGSDGMQFRPNLKIHDRLQLWLSTLYRSTELVSTGATFFHGIRVLRYWPDVSIFAPNPCKSQRIMGLLNITSPLAVGAGGNGSAAAGAPVYVSRPQFCGCDGSLRQGVTGLPGCAEVDPQLAWLDVEPITGITMRAFQSSMVSSEVTLAMREHLEPRVYSSPIIPIFNSHETVEATEDAAKEFVARVYGARRLKAHLHLWPLLLATACASACACVLVHASVTHLKQAQQAEANETEAGRQARQLIIDRVTSQTAARARAAVRENEEMLAARGDLAGAGEIQGVGLDDSRLAQPLLAPRDAAD